MSFDCQVLVTVIIPVYKVEKYLSRCVESILSQTYSRLEIILVDDGSPDRCGEMCDEYRNRDQRVVVVHKKNGGLSSARNAGIKLSHGEFLCFVDSDDYIQTDMIEQLLKAALCRNTRISACDFTSDEHKLQDGLRDDIKLYSAAEAIREILRDGEICTSAWAKLYEKSLFDEISFPEGKYYEDYATTYKLIHKAGNVAFAATKKYFYTINSGGITKSAFSPKHMDYFSISEELEAFVGRNYPELISLVRNRCTDMAISLYRKLSASEDRKRYKIEEKKLSDMIRRDLSSFLFSSYPAAKKLAGLLISASPAMSMKLMSFASGK